MNSLWNFEDGYSIPQEKEVHVGNGCWLPVTPGRPIPTRSHANPIHQGESSMGRPNWPEFGAPSSGYLHEIPSCSSSVQPPNRCEKLPQAEEFYGLDFDFVERNQTTNQPTGPYTQALVGMGDSGFCSGSLSDILASGDAAFIPSVEESLARSLGVENNTLDLNFPAVSSGWRGLNSGSMPMATGTDTFSMEQLNTNCQYGTSKSSQLTYDLNSTPRREVENYQPPGMANPILLTPLTPDQARPVNPQIPILNSLVEESVNQEKNNGVEKSASVAGKEVANHNSDELLQNLVDSFKQKEGTANGTAEGIDLNKTPQQKAPKRRKHRPKVIIEGKAKRTKTSQTPDKSNNATPSTSGKRKYVRKKGLKETPQADYTTVTGVAQERTAVNSARRALNFDMEDMAAGARPVPGRDGRTMRADKTDAVNIGSSSQTMEPSTGTNMFRTAQTSSSEVAQQNGFPQHYHQGNMQGIASTSVDQTSGPIYSFSQLQAAVRQQGMVNQRQSGGNLILASGHSERSLGAGVGHPNNFMGQLSHSEQYSTNAAARQAALQANANLVNTRQALLNRFSQAASNVAREQSPLNGQTHQSSSVVMWQQIFSALSQTQRKTNIEEMPPSVSLPVQDLRQGYTSGQYDMASRMLAAKGNDDMSRSYVTNDVNQLLSNGYLQSMALRRQQALFEQQARSMREESAVVSQMHQTGVVKGVENHHALLCMTQPPPHSPANKQNTSAVSVMMIPAPNRMQAMQPRRNPPQSAGGTRGSAPTMKKASLPTVDEITQRLSNLHLGGEEGAIVPYKGDGSIVLFEAKKRKPRPKVDIDPETNRMWNLLMGKEKDEGIGENNQEKAKWWENEREVFRGRADSFIARMHLVQGDRRFSRWKGSVVDSVIGVFLTQNVSDHLSSSAFISLAARFPVKSSSHNSHCDKGKAKMLLEAPEEFVVNGRDSIEFHTNLEMIHTQSVAAVHSTRECWRDGESSATERANLNEVQAHSLDEEVISSQGSFDCSTVDGSGGIRSYSGSNSESEDLGISQKSEAVHRSASGTCLHGERFMFQDLNNHADGSTLHNLGPESRYEEPPDKRLANGLSSNTHPITFESQITCLSSPPTNLHSQMGPQLRLGDYDVLGEESTSSHTKASTSIGDRGASGIAKQIEQPPESSSRSTVHQDGVLISDQTKTMGQYNLLDKNLTHQQSCSQTEPQSVVIQASQSNLENTRGEPNSSEQSSSSAKTYKEEDNTKQVKAKGAKAQVEKKIDWDYLRRDVQANGARKERSEDAVDSLDYEAMRRATIKEISDTIRERGMNNMLAERIKDFLNRLIEDHGSIDLEWLRDVPPDKAKDYLLSIRGLGLKSVECVRLLTLHHLAFPVDTNVGRIAVRLGWVPLQPLPETMQLHLLELYPILESVQKYLWPRLCKLDQPTLYELHYQLITFGKVFCTKTKPNCNACPMRSECRHFASAFASARLALPGPEEKGIVNSTVPLAESSTSVRIDPVTLPQLENHPVKEGNSEAVNCQPIIEEPASPEQEREVVETDIEDRCYGEVEDDDEEIPTIKLNIEEFTENLQSFMQKNNMELQEGDMSKALVALNPAFASIPTRKLKYISRLRTEHQVYELPDDHPLLEGMEKREPDDPSPYLLAIWRPGETANTTDPPEKICAFKEDKGELCDVETCYPCNSIREANSQIVRGTLLIPCRTAMRGSFPLNGTYFQVNEMFADHVSSNNPIVLPTKLIWNLRRRTVYFGTSVTSIFRGLTTEEIQYCFWKGFVCVRGFDRGARAPRPLVLRLHFPNTKSVKTK